MDIHGFNDGIIHNHLADLSFHLFINSTSNQIFCVQTHQAKGDQSQKSTYSDGAETIVDHVSCQKGRHHSSESNHSTCCAGHIFEQDCIDKGIFGMEGVPQQGDIYG